MRTEIFRLTAAVFAAALVGCATMAPLPSANLEEPGWTVRQGQALLKEPGKPEIAGEIMVATRNDGEALVQLTKNPFPLVTARSTPHGWQVQSHTDNKFYSGHGKPPNRIIFLHVPRMLAGESAPKGWSYQKLAEGGYRIENSGRGESLEIYFDQ